ncbi:hypothetical protein DJ018_11105 [Phenylobacterium deserti]|uniref:Uncharacterized protein n=2 Tax=Phenylobacterium deserti TaxID=1914756 RepID=A0A328ADJ1_9CAUL|nr:hypothetical protein DJ018_11105 [Phenylobacterium deserti]
MVSQKQFAYRRDELEADLDVLRGLDLINLGSEVACDVVVRLRRNLNTARRRLRVVEERVAHQKPPGPSEFGSLVEQVKETRQRVDTTR